MPIDAVPRRSQIPIGARVNFLRREINELYEDLPCKNRTSEGYNFKTATGLFTAIKKGLSDLKLTPGITNEENDRIDFFSDYNEKVYNAHNSYNEASVARNSSLTIGGKLSRKRKRNKKSKAKRSKTRRYKR